MTNECDCGAATEGKWAGIHHHGCASVSAVDVTTEDQQIIADLLAENVRLKAEVEKLTRCLHSRDDFLVSRNMFSDYTATLSR